MNLIDTILAPTIPHPALGVEHAGNWPASAVMAVAYNVRDRQFPQVEHSPTTIYFDSEAEYYEWRQEKQEWIRGTDYDFSLDGCVYKWDWGPVYIGPENL